MTLKGLLYRCDYGFLTQAEIIVLGKAVGTVLHLTKSDGLEKKTSKYLWMIQVKVGASLSCTSLYLNIWTSTTMGDSLGQKTKK